MERLAMALKTPIVNMRFMYLLPFSRASEICSTCFFELIDLAPCELVGGFRKILLQFEDIGFPIRRDTEAKRVRPSDGFGVSIKPRSRVCRLAAHKLNRGLTDLKDSVRPVQRSSMISCNLKLRDTWIMPDDRTVHAFRQETRKFLNRRI